jgi:hypothetical protein
MFGAMPTNDVGVTVNADGTGSVSSPEGTMTVDENG